MKDSVFMRVWRFYYEGFRDMTSLGRSLWIIIAIKLFIMFFILKLFFFKSDLRDYNSFEEKSDKVIENLTNTK
jgi:hypothetical protein